MKRTAGSSGTLPIKVWSRPVVWEIVVAMVVVAATIIVAGLGRGVAEAQAGAAQGDQNELTIESDSNLPDAYPHTPYELRFRARNGIPVLHWRVVKISRRGEPLGDLPPGLKLEDSGLLHGEPERSGEFQFTVAVIDGSGSPGGVQKNFVLRVKSALMLDWKSGAHVNGSRIEGTVAVTNTTQDDMDLTFDVKAMAENGRATEIGYQHFVLKRGTIAMVLPFGENLPHGGYLVRVDAVGEVEAKNLIYRESLQTPGPLHVNVGP